MDFPFSVYLDTNSINARGDDKSLNTLEKFLGDHGSDFEKTSVLDTELLKGYRPGLAKSAGMIESMESAVWGHSRWGHSVWGSEKDDQKLTEILECIFGKKPRTEYSEQQIRDAMHLQTAGKYGGSYFVTRDKEILAKADEIRSICGGVLACTPEDCLDALQKRTSKLKSS